MMEFAPGLSSTTTGWPTNWLISAAIVLGSRSASVPGLLATIMRMGLLGKVCADVPVLARSAATSAYAQRNGRKDTLFSSPGGARFSVLRLKVHALGEGGEMSRR